MSGLVVGAMSRHVPSNVVLLAHYMQEPDEEETQKQGRFVQLIPFIYSWASFLQLMLLLWLGHKRPLFMDATFSTNKYKFYLITLLVVDLYINAIPVCFALTSSESQETYVTWLGDLVSRIIQSLRWVCWCIAPCAACCC